ncbi:hypothetical protein MM5_116 [Morganella phage vB_Mm5]
MLVQELIDILENTTQTESVISLRSTLEKLKSDELVEDIIFDKLRLQLIKNTCLLDNLRQCRVCGSYIIYGCCCGACDSVNPSQYPKINITNSSKHPEYNGKTINVTRTTRNLLTGVVTYWHEKAQFSEYNCKYTIIEDY